MAPTPESDFPPGHPARADFDPHSAEAREWVRQNIHPLGERDFPVGHPAALDTPGALNRLVYEAGVDPLNPHLEPFTGRTPEQAKAVRELSLLASELARESPATQPIDATAVNAALDAKRRSVGRDELTAAEYREVLAAVQQRPTQPEG